MNYKQILEVYNKDGSFDIATDGDYIILLKDTTFATADYSETDVPFKAGTVFEVIYEDEDDMGCWYVVELKDGVPGSYVNRDQEYIIGMGKEDIKNTKCVNKRDYEIKHQLTPSTLKTFGELIDEL
jgi:hypothetical protein